MGFLKTMNNEVKNLTLIDIAIPEIEKKTLTLARDIVLVFGFALLTSACAKLKIEIGLVPITMQTLAVLLSGAVLGAKRGGLAQLTYLLMGIGGIPWFSHGGGISYLLSPTFGYIIGFVPAAYLTGWLCQKGFDRKIKTAIGAMILGNVLLYIPGLLWLAKFVGFGRVLEIGFYPFIPGDLLKVILAGAILPLIWKMLKKHKYEYVQR